MPVEYMTRSECTLTTRPLLDKLDEVIKSNKGLREIILGNDKAGFSGRVLLAESRIESIQKFLESQSALNEQLTKMTAVNNTRYKIAIGVFVVAVLTMIAQIVFKF